MVQKLPKASPIFKLSCNKKERKKRKRMWRESEKEEKERESKVGEREIKGRLNLTLFMGKEGGTMEKQINIERINWERKCERMCS